MLYEVTHYLQAKMPWVWKFVEWGNSEVFALQYRRKLNGLPALLENFTGRFKVTQAVENDAYALAKFFAEQPEEAFKFFHPHEFDEKTIRKLANRKSFLMFLVKDNNKIVGYFFLRCFVNGNAYRGRMVDNNRRNQGIGKLMGTVLNEVSLWFRLKMYSSISPENYASLASAKAASDIKIVRILENGYYYVECTPKANSWREKHADG